MEQKVEKTKAVNNLMHTSGNFMVAEQKKEFLKIFSVIFPSLLPVILLYDFISRCNICMLLDIIVAVVLVCLRKHIEKPVFRKWGTRFVLALGIGICVSGSTDMSIMIWLPVFPVISFALTSEMEAAIWSLLCFIAVTIEICFFSDFTGNIYVSSSLNYYRRGMMETFFAFFTTFVVSFIYDRQRRRIEKYLRTMATTDELTGAGNRLGFYTAITKHIETATTNEHPLSLIMFDLDNFKHINDNFGHEKGDEFLKRMVTGIQNHLRKNVDYIARLGGDEFVIILPRTTLSEALPVANRVRNYIISLAGGLNYPVSASFGVVQFKTNENADELLKRADTLMYHSKQSGKNNISSEGV